MATQLATGGARFDMEAASLLAQFKAKAAQDASFSASTTTAVNASSINSSSSSSSVVSPQSTPMPTSLSSTPITSTHALNRIFSASPCPPPKVPMLIKPMVPNKVLTMNLQPRSCAVPMNVVGSARPSNGSSSEVPISVFIQQHKQKKHLQAHSDVSFSNRRSRAVSMDGCGELGLPPPKPLAHSPRFMPLSSLTLARPLTPPTVARPIAGSSATFPPMLLEHHDWRGHSRGSCPVSPAQKYCSSSASSSSDEESDEEDACYSRQIESSDHDSSDSDGKTTSNSTSAASCRNNKAKEVKSIRTVARCARKSFVGESSNATMIRSVLRKGFSWRQFPELEDYLRTNRDEYFSHSSLNYTMEQRRYNNSLTKGLLQLANDVGYVFEGFTFAMVRDRIRCYYKSYVQSVKKRKQPGALTK